MRRIQPQGTRGSLKWVQRAVAHRPDVLVPAVLGTVRWVSPLADDAFAEYRDAAFLHRVGQGHLSTALAAFWPGRGPQWDALGIAGDGAPVLVEAKAHLAEFRSPPCAAGAASMARIVAAFDRVKAGLGAAPGADWTQAYYQYANRLAHLWWFHAQGVRAHLVLCGFLHDADMGGPADMSAWTAAYAAADSALGLPARHALAGHVHHVAPDVRALA
jgi:hypothetical protein